MKEKYRWYIRPTEKEFSDIWNTGVLTVDANVLLDLYRYNDATRESLIASLEQFRGRVWLSSQAADEFIRNRHKAIMSVTKSFNEAQNEVTKLRSSLDSVLSQLKGNRIVSQEVTTKLSESVTDAIDKAEEEISKANTSHPDFLYKDPILDRILELFDGAVGDRFTEEQQASIDEEAQRRIEQDIPPGYLDDDKGNNNKYGDYRIWREILEQAREKGAPVVFVTSERKSDWWQIISGRTVGPRPELLKESFDYTNQRFLIYRTERFLEYAAESTGTEVDESALEDIVAVGESRANNTATVELLDQEVTRADTNWNAGRLRVRLLRSTYSFTSSGHFDPSMSGIPKIKIRLSETPEDMPRYKLAAGAGTDFDFNAHVKSLDFGKYLPMGDYTFEYAADSESFTDPPDSEDGGT